MRFLKILRFLLPLFVILLSIGAVVWLVIAAKARHGRMTSPGDPADRADRGSR